MDYASTWLAMAGIPNPDTYDGRSILAQLIPASVRAFYLSAPSRAMGQRSTLLHLIATMPGRHSGDQVHKVKKNAAPFLMLFF